LVGRWFVSIFDASTTRRLLTTYFSTSPSRIILTEEQKIAIESIQTALDKHEHNVFLLHGITGSGKTEVYLRTIAHALKLKRTAIVLVPEIALTPQTVERFKSRFGEIVAVLHSGLSEGERFDQWRRIRSGESQVVVGARSALFAPAADLGLIVIDEEHEATYKQNRNPRYDARKVAIERARLNQAVVILGSATPAIESKYQALQKEFISLTLTSRVEDRKLPEMEMVDMRRELAAGNRSIFSTILLQEMIKCLQAGEKMILFLNRRGYSNFILCRECGLVIKCPNCAVSLNYHQDGRTLKCHHCNFDTSAPRVCPRCQSIYLRHFGMGTQRVENEIRTFLPQIPIIRVDADTVARKDAHRKKLMEFKRMDRAILLGTQMIAKGLEFPEVTLVGIINADTALNLPDFRAAERTFQLMMQVSGRAGRGNRPGRVILQTYSPESYAIENLQQGDYDKFYERELSFRRELGYPPFSSLINILVSSPQEPMVIKVAESLGELLRKNGVDEVAQILGPAPAPLERLKGRYGWHIVLKSYDLERTRSLVKTSLSLLRRSSIGSEDRRDIFSGKISPELNIVVDVDPVWML